MTPPPPMKPTSTTHGMAPTPVKAVSTVNAAKTRPIECSEPRDRLRVMRRALVFAVMVFLLTGLADQRGPGPGVSVASAQPPAPSLDALMRGFSRMPGLYARFTEEKHIALLAVPVRSEGELFFAPPGRLLRRVTSPTTSAALIEGERLIFAGDGRREEIPLDEASGNSVVAGFVGSFRHVLAGDTQSLNRTFEVDYTRDGASWRLTLRPRTEALRRFMRDMVLHGESRSVLRMVMTERSGDVTTTTFRDVDTARRFTAAEQARLFRL